MQQEGSCKWIGLFLLHPSHLSDVKDIYISESTQLNLANDSSQLQSFLIDGSMNSKAEINNLVEAMESNATVSDSYSQAIEDRAENKELLSLFRGGHASIQPMIAIMTDKNEQKKFFAQVQIYYESTSSGMLNKVIIVLNQQS